LAKRGITIETFLGEIPHFVSNSILITQVLLNLVLNARQAIGEKKGKIAIHANAAPEAVSIRVVDNGPGMTAEQQSNIFNPTNSGTSTTGGMGIGLWTCQRLVRHFLSGEIDLKSELGVGTEFIVRLPLKTKIPIV
jgi:signal transduction histidine kinase